VRKLTVLLLAAGLAASAAAYTGMTGGRGFFRVQDARCEGKWKGSLMFHGIQATYPYEQVPESTQFYLEPGDDVTVQDVLATASISPNRYFELFCWGGAVREYVVKDGWGYHGLVPGVKLSLPIIPVFKLGALGAYSFYPILDDFRGEWYFGKFGLPFVNGLIWSGLATFDFREVADWTPLLHVNYGQAMDSYDDAEIDEPVENTITTLGAALEYPIDKLDVFVEFVAQQAGEDGLFDNTSRMFVSPGVKIGYLKPLIIDLGASVGLSDAAPDLELIAGIGVQGKLWKPRKPTTGTVAGRVIDSETGMGVPAMVTLPGLEFLPMATDPVLGTFEFGKLAPGTVVLEAKADGYLPGQQVVGIRVGMTNQVEFALVPEATTGTITGIVTDAASGEPLAARVEFPGSDLAPQATDGDGMYELAGVAEGEYAVQVSAEGYLTASSSVEVVAKEMTEADYELVKKGVKITLKVYFDVGKSDLKPESKDALDAAAKILRENPEIKVEIQGHTDNTGSPSYNRGLSLKRAQAVVAALVGQHGVAGDRLTARGLGPDKPVADNGHAEGRALNRRVEFVVVE